jgi:hypothetical protein
MAIKWKGPGCLLLGKKLYKPGQELPAGALTAAPIVALGDKVDRGAVAAVRPPPAPVPPIPVSAPAPFPLAYTPEPIKRGPGRPPGKVGPR